MSILSLLGLFACGSGYNNLSTEEFAKAIAAGEMAVVDVRTPDEYAADRLRPPSELCLCSDFTHAQYIYCRR